MTNEEYKELLAESGGVTTDSDEKKSVEKPPRLDKKDEEILDKAWKAAAKSKTRYRKPIAA